MIYLYDGTATDFTYNGQPLPKARNTLVDYLINDEFYVTFKYPLDKDNIYKQIEKDKIITAHTPDGMQPFRIIDRASHANYIEVEAWPLFYADMRRKSVRPLALRNATGHTAIKQFLNNLLIDTPFEITTNITETHDYHTQNETERENNPNQYYDALEVFKAIVNRWNGEVFINGYDVRVVDRIGVNKEALLYEEKNIAEFVDKESMAELVTRLHGKAQWTEDRDDGEQIEHSIQTTVDSPLIDAYSGVVFEKQYTNNDLRTEQELQNWLNLMFTTDNVDKPTRNIEVGTNVIDGQSINAGDGLVLKYIKHDVDMQIRMVGYQYDGFADRYIKVYLGDAKDSLTGSLKNSISNVENNVNNNVQQIAHTIINSMGQKLIYSETEPQGNFREGDTWFDNQGGMFFWDEERADWIPHPYNRRTDVVEQLLQEAQQDIAEAQATADNAITEIEIAIDAAGFTSLSDSLTGIQSISQTAQSNAIDAWNNAQTALGDASTALSSATEAISQVSNIDVRVDEVEGTLLLKADSQEVNTLTGIVNNHTLDIQANAEGLALKANQDTVDTLAGTVSSLGTDIGVVAGQVNSRVWNTDIEMAIDELSYENRNYLLNSGEPMGTYSATTGLEASITPEGYYKIVAEDGNGNWFYPLELYQMRSNGQIERNFDIGEKFTFSVDIKSPDSTDIPSFFANGGIQSYTMLEGKMTTDFSRFQITGVWNSLSSMNLVFGLIGRSGTFIFRRMKLEKGTKATPWTPAPEDTLTRFDHIETEWSQKFDSFSQTVTDIDGRVSSQEQTINGIQSVVYDPETGLSSLNTQLANLVQVAVTGEEMTGAISVLENNINARVEKGDVLSQINIEAGRTLIQSDKLYLDAQTVAFSGQAFIPGAVIEDLSADKITTGTLFGNEVTASGINVNTLVGNRAEFVRLNLNSALGGNVSATGDGIVTTASNGAQGLIQNGVFLTRIPSSNGYTTLGYIGYDQVGSSPALTANTSLGAHFKVRQHLGSQVYKDVFTLESGGVTARFNVDQVINDGGNFRAYEFKPRYGGGFYSTSGYETRVYSGSPYIYFMVNGNAWTDRKFAVNEYRIYSYVPLNMNGHRIMDSGGVGIRSERKYKSNILPIDNAIATVEQMNFYSYIKEGRSELGIIADEAPDQVLMSDKKTVDIYSYATLIGKSQQELIAMVKEMRDEITELKGMIA